MKALMHRSCLSALETLFSAVGAARSQQKFAETSSCRDCWAMFLGWDDGRWSGNGMRSCAATHPISLPRSWLRREAKWIQDNPEESVANRKGLSWLLNLPNVLFRLIFVRLDLDEWAILSLCEGGGKGKQQKEKAKITQAAVVMCFSIALLFFCATWMSDTFNSICGKGWWHDPCRAGSTLTCFGLECCIIIVDSSLTRQFLHGTQLLPCSFSLAAQRSLPMERPLGFGVCLLIAYGTYVEHTRIWTYTVWLVLPLNPLNICQGTAAHLLHRTLHGFLMATIVQSMAIYMDLSPLLAK